MSSGWSPQTPWKIGLKAIESAPLITEIIGNEHEEERLKLLQEPHVKEFIERGDIFKSFIQEYSKVYTGNINPVIAVEIATASRGMEFPLHLYLVAPQGAGKNWSINPIEKSFRRDEFIVITASSPLGILQKFKQDGIDLQGTVVNIKEIDSMPQGDNAIASGFREATSGEDGFMQLQSHLKMEREN